MIFYTNFPQQITSVLPNPIKFDPVNDDGLLIEEKSITVKTHYKNYQAELPEIIDLLYTKTIVTINDRAKKDWMVKRIVLKVRF
jgi:hypothetical protein